MPPTTPKGDEIGLMWRVSPDMMCVIDATGRFTAVNPAWDSTLGWTESDMVGQAPCATGDAELRHDLARALGDLPEDARELCAALGTCAIVELVGRTGISRSALYRHIARLRLDLAMRGFGARWWSAAPSAPSHASCASIPSATGSTH